MINILTRARRSIPMSRRTRAESFGALSRHSKCIVRGVLGGNVAFEIVISKKEDKFTKFGWSIKSGVLIQRSQTKVLRTRADLSFALVHNLELLTHFLKRAENERCFSIQNRDEKKTEMRKNIPWTIDTKTPSN